jgi:hypothetical protein
LSRCARRYPPPDRTAQQPQTSPATGTTMRVSTIRSVEHAHKQLIRFIGKRSHPSSNGYMSPVLLPRLIAPDIAPAERHAHPAAPSDIAATFAKFLEKPQLDTQIVKPPTGSAGNASSQSGVFAEAWEAPSRFWRSRLPVEEREIEAVLVSNVLL